MQMLKASDILSSKWFQRLPATWLATLYAKQKFLECKKGEANEKQQLSAFSYMVTCDQFFDINFRPRIS